MKHIRTTTQSRPAKAYFYNISLTQKLSELTTIVSLVGSVKGLFGGDSAE